MGKILILLWKEIRDNLRDKRSLFFALIYGPILMPAITMGPLVFKIKGHEQSFDSGREYHVIGETLAPNLITYLKSRNLDPITAEPDYQTQLSADKIKIVLEITDSYATNLQEGKPAKLILHYNNQNSASQSLYWQLRGELDGYSRTLAAQRLAIRGFDQNLLRVLDITDNDLSQEQLSSSILANITLFMMIFASIMGGFYLAVDIFAGERERNTLEPLLSLAISPMQLMIGKFLAILAFCVGSYILPIISIFLWSLMLPETFFGDADIPTAVTFIKLALLCLPLCIFIATLLTLIATYSKSIKEAQTQISIAMIIPVIPFAPIMAFNLKSTPLLDTIPLLGQFLLASQIMMVADEPWLNILPPALSTLLLASILLAIALHLFRQDNILND